MNRLPKEYWIDEIKCNNAVSKVVWKDRFDKGEGWVSISNLTNAFTKFSKQCVNQFNDTSLNIVRNFITDQIFQYAHQNSEYKVYKITNEVPQFHILTNKDWHLHLYPYNDGVMVYTINVNEDKRGNGIGTEVLNKLYDISEELSIPIYLIPYPDYEFLDKLDKEKELVDKLKNYYTRIGFGPVSEGSLVWCNFE